MPRAPPAAAASAVVGVPRYRAAVCRRKQCQAASASRRWLQWWRCTRNTQPGPVRPATPEHLGIPGRYAATTSARCFSVPLLTGAPVSEVDVFTDDAGALGGTNPQPVARLGVSAEPDVATPPAARTRRLPGARQPRPPRCLRRSCSASPHRGTSPTGGWR